MHFRHFRHFESAKSVENAKSAKVKFNLMIQFKYTLDKSSKKFVCPRCNKKSFVKYIETESNNYLSDKFGRCDHESSCQYFLTPDKEETIFKIVDIPKPETSYHSLELVNQSMSNLKKNNFIQFLKTLFTEIQVQEVINKYFIGTSKYWNGATIFWQIDNLDRVHHGKIMLFNPETGKRTKDKDGKGYINSVRSVLRLQDFNLSQCLFGLHLISETRQNTIAVVESEKTAVLMSIFKPEYIWLSTGSKSGLKYEFLKPIKNFKIVAFPDKSEFSDWNNKAIELNRFGFKISVSGFLEKSNYPDGTDLADVFLFEKLKGVEVSPAEKIINVWDQKGFEIGLFLENFEIDKNEIQLM